jgi:hypothetical protein
MIVALFGWLQSFLGASYDWLFGPIDPKPQLKSRVAPLIDARDDIRRQIDILSMGPINYRDVTPQRARLLEDLRHALREVEAEIERLRY